MRRRAQIVEKRINLPYLVFAVVSFLLWVMMIWQVDPAVVKDLGIEGVYLPFFVLMLMWMLGLLKSMGVGMVRSIIWSGVIAMFLGLRMMGLGNVLNALLFGSLLITYEYLRKIMSK